MPSRFIISILSLVFSFTLFTSSVWAASSTLLTHIGTLSTPQQYPQWWYTGANPVLRGQVVANATVTVTIDDTPQSATADASGLWSFTPTTLTSGDHQISLQSDADTYNFTLTIGSQPPTDTTVDQTTETGTGSGELLVAGSSNLTMILILIGTVIILGSGYNLLRAKI